MTPLPDMPDMGEGLANLASLASIATDMQQTARKWGAAALDGTDADELALLVLTIRATRRAALHIQTLAEEATP